MKKAGALTLGVAAIAAGVFSSCSSVNCTAELRSSLVVTVLNGAATEICDATVTARDGGFLATLHVYGNTPPCNYDGPYERRGTYTVTAQANGQSTSMAGIQVTGDQCHVHTRDVTLTLG